MVSSPSPAPEKPWQHGRQAVRGPQETASLLPFLSFLRLGTACVVTMLAVGTVFMNQSIFMEIAGSFSLNAQGASVSFSVASLCYSLTFLFAGPLADTFDCRKISAAALALIALLLVGAAGMHEYPWFLACTGLTGLAAAAVPASLFPYVSRLAPAHKSGVYVGAIVASATLGIVVGRAALGASTSFMGWRASYRLFALLFALLAVTSAYLLKTTKKNEKNTYNIGKLYAEMFRMLITPEIVSLLLTGFFLFFGFLGAITFLTYRLTSPPFSFNSAQVGYISFAGLVAVIAPFSGELSRRYGTRQIILPSLILTLAALQLLYWGNSVLLTTLGVLLLFLGVYACQPLLFLLIGRRIAANAMGCASSLYILCCIGGGSIASLVLGTVWKAYGWSGITLVCSASISIALGIAVMDNRKERAAGGTIRPGA